MQPRPDHPCDRHTSFALPGIGKQSKGKREPFRATGLTEVSTVHLIQSGEVSRTTKGNEDTEQADEDAKTEAFLACV